MSIRMMVLIGAVVVLICVAGGYAFHLNMDSREKESRVDDLVEKGFAAVETEPDKAISLALEAREIDESRPEPFLLLGRANYIKRHYQKAMDSFLEGLDLSADRPELHPEFQFHAGLSALNLHIETRSKSDGREALRLLSNAAAEGGHQADAYFALCRLYWQEGLFDLDSIALNRKKGLAAREDLEDYPGSKDDGACPHCRMAFDSDAVRENRIGTLLAEGFEIMETDPDRAIEKGREAERIGGAGPGSCLLLGRAHFLKGKAIQAEAGEAGLSSEAKRDALRSFRSARDCFKRGLFLPLKEIDLLPEFSYHAGLACMVLFAETNDDVLWQEGRSYLDRAAKMGAHQADASFALGIYFMQKGYENANRIVEYWEDGIRLEEALDGYPGSGEDGCCPHCSIPFSKKQDLIAEQLKILKGE